jgi:molybdopterin converting factor small subunit
MSVVVELFGILAREVGTKEVVVEIEDSISVEQLLEDLTKRLGDKFTNKLIDKSTKKFVPLLLMINGKDAPWEVTRTRTLVSGDRVTILPPIAGG